MVKYTIAMLQAMVVAKPTGPIYKIHELPTFIILCNLQRQLVDGLCKVGNFKFLLDVHAGCILSKEAFVLFLIKECRDPGEVGKYYKIPVTSITETEQITEEEKIKFKKREERYLR